MSGSDPNAKLQRAAYRLCSDPEFAALLEWWEAQLNTARVPTQMPVDPLRLAMAQGDRERLALIRLMSKQHRAAQEAVQASLTS